MRRLTRRAFLTLSGLALARVARADEFGLFLPGIMASERPVVALPARTGLRRGGSCVREPGDMQQLRADWYHNWTPRPLGALQGYEFAPQIRDLAQLAALPDMAHTPVVRLFNEPNAAQQANMTLSQVVDGVHQAMQTLKPRGVLVGCPELFYPYMPAGDPLSYSHTGIVTLYRQRYGEPPRYDFLCLHQFAYEPGILLQSLDQQYQELRGLGYEELPVWISEWGAWPDALSEGERLALLREGLAGIRARPWITREAWFPCRWNASYTASDPASVDWTPCRLLDDEGAPTPLGAEYAG